MNARRAHRGFGDEAMILANIGAQRQAKKRLLSRKWILRKYWCPGNPLTPIIIFIQRPVIPT
jgi:hypothetical protein